MATELELTIHKDYVKTWGIKEALRELIQNAIDQMTTNPENLMICEYDSERMVLRIGNKLSVLDRNTLLMGQTSKSGDSKTIGQFGEGYKLALLVLTRMKHPTAILNYGTKERWVPAIKHSRKYRAHVLTIVITRYIFKSVPDNNLVFEVGGITPEIYAEFVKSTLHLQDIDENHFLRTSSGRVIMHEDYKGKIFVNGLFVCTSKLNFGYDLNPDQIKLDRDRSVVGDFDMQWLTSKMWAELGETYYDLVSSLLNSGHDDVKYMDKVACYTNRSVVVKVHEEFRENHGYSAVPVVDQREYDQAKSRGHNPVIVKENVKELIKSSPNYIEPDNSSAGIRLRPSEHIERIVDQYGAEMSEELFKELQNLQDLARKWTWS